jgi:predicted nucleotidyltransferase component of viral defense system
MNNEPNIYYQQAKLVIDTLSYVAKEESFALKGGTAINFFIRDLPRLSIDIDLDYIGFEPKEEATIKINEALKRIVKNLRKDGQKADIKKGKDNIQKIARYNKGIEIKIEINYVTRGFIYQPSIRQVNPKVEEKFGFASLNVLSLPELYGGKIHAALKRQHPRDLFDIKILFENDGITEEIKKCFMATLFSSKGTPYELLSPNIFNQENLLKTEFTAMTDIEFTYQDHEKTLQKLINTLHKTFTKDDKDFIVGFFSLNPNWALVEIPNLQRLPAVKWKIKNLEKMDKQKLSEQVIKIKEAFEAHRK